MNCFYHPGVTAVGICKLCNRGLCPGCAAELPNGIACKSRCEEGVKLYDRLVEKNDKSYQLAGPTYYLGALMLAVMSIGFFVLGLIVVDQLRVFSMVFSAAMAIGAVAFVFQAIKMR